MPQLVGQSCTHCQERIGSVLDGRFCGTCGSPVHAACVPRAAGPADGGCAACRTAASFLRDRAAQRRAALEGLAAERRKAGRTCAGGECPACGLVNPPGAQRCDCGYDFVDRVVRGSHRGPMTTAELLICTFIPLVGLILGSQAKRDGRLQAGQSMTTLSGANLLLGVVLAAIRVAARM